MTEAMQHVVALSGGKDSTALALWLVENEAKQDYVASVFRRGFNRLPFTHHRLPPLSERGERRTKVR